MHGISNENVVFIASSNCGFASLYLADRILGSKCIALNPQIDLRLHVGTHFGKVMGIDVNDPTYFDRLNVARILENKVSKFFICFNLRSDMDIPQARLLFKLNTNFLGLYQLGYNVKVLCFDIDATTPHMVQPDEYFCRAIETIMDSPITQQSTELCEDFVESMRRYYFQNKTLNLKKGDNKS